MQGSQVRWFRSKVDWWLALVLVAVPMSEIAALAEALVRGDQKGSIAAATGVMVAAAVYGLLLVPVRYGLSDDCLIIRHGVIRRHIALDSIDEVRRTRSPLAAPALSLDRHAVRVRTPRIGFHLVSPLEREQFLAELATRAGLTREGDRLVR